MNGISFKGAVVTKTTNEYSPRIIQDYYYKQNGEGGNRNIPLDLNLRSSEVLNLVLWGEDNTKFNDFFAAHKDEIPAKTEDLVPKPKYLDPWSTGQIRLSKLAAALVNVLNIPKAETSEEVDTFIANPKNLTNEVVTEDSLMNALNKIKGNKQ